MQNNERQNQAPGLSLADIYYILFRHKWKIIGLSAAGLLAAALVYYLQPRMYSSEAKLFIRYVVEARPPSANGSDPQIKTPDSGGASIINSEIEIIKSLDLAAQVAEEIGPTNFLSGETDKYKAAAILEKGLTVEVVPQSDILRIVFQHPTNWIVKPVLEKIISAYMDKHVAIHRSIGDFDQELDRQKLSLGNDLRTTVDKLQFAKSNAALAGVISIEDSKKAYTEEISKIRQEFLHTEAELAGRWAAFMTLTNALSNYRQEWTNTQAGLEGRQAPSKTLTNSLPAETETSSVKPEAEVPPDKVREYKKEYTRVSEQLESCLREEQRLTAIYTDINPMVRGNHERIVALEKRQRELVEKYPKLAEFQPSSSKPGVPGVDPLAARITALEAESLDEVARIEALRVTRGVLFSQMTNLMSDQAKVVNNLEPNITELQRQRDLAETKFRQRSTSLEQALFDKDLSSAVKKANISEAQSPTQPRLESRQLIKTLAIIVGAGVFGGIALAFVLELFFDPTVRRPVEIETRLHLPLFLTIPRMRRKGLPALPAPAVPGAGQPGAGEAGAEPGTNKQSEVVPWHANGLASYYEALRDRLVNYFEIKNLTHRPKLVAVTGCARGAGVTTIATGLAATLSETGDGNVLLVDMTFGQGAARPYFKGRPGCDLADALEGEKRDGAMVQENLYMVTEGGNGDKLPRILPRRFNSLVPKLKASDYDYVIFDMPPVSQISITPRLAGFMDMVLLVIESGKTDREVVKRATSMLAGSRATVSAILNKNRDYVPKRLSQDL